MPSPISSRNQEKEIEQYHIIDTQYWIDMFDKKRDVYEEIWKHINSSHHHPIKILMPQPVIGEFIVKSIDHNNEKRINDFIKFLFQKRDLLDFPILKHLARKIANRIHNERLTPIDLYIVSIGIFYAKIHQDSKIILYTNDGEVIEEYTKELGTIHKYLMEEEINNFKISELR